MYKDRRHILNFTVGAIWNRMGVGRQMAEELINKTTQGDKQRTYILAEVRETNVAAQKFFCAVGFRAVKVLPGFYDGQTDEDAYLFRYDHEDAEAKP